MRIYTNKNAENYKKQCKAAFFGFSAELPNLILTVISAVFAGTLVVWSDALVSFGATLHCFMVFLVADKLRKENGDKYNFGMGRVEVLTSLLSDALMLAGYATLAGVAVWGLIYPTRPADSLFLFIILKISNIGFDIYFCAMQVAINKKHNSRMNRTEWAHYRNALTIDLITLSVVCACYFLRDFTWSWYISPVATLIMVSGFGVQSAKRIKEAVSDLSDASIPVEKQDKIFDILLEHQGIYEKIYAVNCRMLNFKIFVEIELRFRESATYKEIRELLHTLQAEIKQAFPESHTCFIIKGNKDGLAEQGIEKEEKL